MIKSVDPCLRISGTIAIPPDKSIAHRAAIFSAVSKFETRISNFPRAEDPQSTLQCIRKLGVPVAAEGNEVVIQGVGRDGLRSPVNALDCGNSGTTMRLMAGLLAGAGVPSSLDGDSSLRSRPMNRIIEPLRKMDLAINAKDDVYAPLVITQKKRIKPIQYELPVASAQVKSCVLLAGLYGEGKTYVIEKLPTRNHTENMLGLKVQHQGSQTVISSSVHDVIPDQTMRVPGDFSAAAFWIVAASIHPDAELTLTGTGINESRTALLNILERMGADIELFNHRREGKEAVADLKIHSSELQPTDVYQTEVPNAIDELPVLAVAMACAEGKSSIRNAAELRYKETDRLKAIAGLLENAGVEVLEYEDGIEITGRAGRRFEAFETTSQNDHRIAMAAGVMALCSKAQSHIHEAEAASVSYPGFWDDLESVTEANTYPPEK